MIASQVALYFHARKFGKGYRAKCPAHGSKSLTLAIRDTEDWVQVTCFAGCTRDEILASVGLKVRDLARRERENPKNRDAERKRRQAAYERVAWKRYDETMHLWRERNQPVQMYVGQSCPWPLTKMDITLKRVGDAMEQPIRYPAWPMYPVEAYLDSQQQVHVRREPW